MRSGLLPIGIVILVVGILIIAIDQPRVSAVESIFGGWAMLSPEYQSLLQELMFGYALAVTGIGFVLASVIKSKSKALICSYCNFVAMSETELNAHLAKDHLDKSPFKCEHCDFIGFTEDVLRNHYNDEEIQPKKHAEKDIPKETLTFKKNYNKLMIFIEEFFRTKNQYTTFLEIRALIVKKLGKK